MNVFTVYGATEVVMVGLTPTTGKVWLSWNTKEKVRHKLEAETIAGRVLANVRR